MRLLSLISLGCLTCWCSIAVAQPPEPAVERTPLVSERTNKLHSQELMADMFGRTLDLNYKDVDVVALLRHISLYGNVEVIIRNGVSGIIKQVHLDKVSPENAIEKIAETAGFSWKLDGKTYIVGPKAPGTANNNQADPRVTLTMIENVSASRLLKMIGEAAEVTVRVDEGITDEIRFIRLNNETAEGAIKKIAEAAGLMWHKDPKSNYIITKAAK